MVLSLFADTAVIMTSAMYPKAIHILILKEKTRGGLLDENVYRIRAMYYT